LEDGIPAEWVKHVPTSNHRYTMYWPYARSDPKDPNPQPNQEENAPTHDWTLDNLTTTMKYVAHETHALGMSNTNTLYYSLWHQMKPCLNLKYTNYFLTNPSTVPHAVTTTILKCRTGTLLTMNNARKYGWTCTAACPLCGANDGIFHTLGSCPPLMGLVTSRHHTAGRIIKRAIIQGSKGASLIQADVGHDAEQDSIDRVPRHLPRRVWGDNLPATQPSIPDLTLQRPRTGN